MKQREARERVSVDLVEVTGRVSVAEVARPAAQEPVEVLHDVFDREQQPPRAVISRMRSRACCIAWREGQRARKVRCRERRCGRAPSGGGSRGNRTPSPPSSRCTIRVLAVLELEAQLGQDQPRAPSERASASRLGLAHHQQIVGVADQNPVPALCPLPVKPVQVDVAQAGRDHPALRGPAHARA